MSRNNPRSGRAARARWATSLLLAGGVIIMAAGAPLAEQQTTGADERRVFAPGADRLPRAGRQRVPGGGQREQPPDPHAGGQRGLRHRQRVRRTGRRPLPPAAGRRAGADPLRHLQPLARGPSRRPSVLDGRRPGDHRAPRVRGRAPLHARICRGSGDGACSACARSGRRSRGAPGKPRRTPGSPCGSSPTSWSATGTTRSSWAACGSRCWTRRAPKAPTTSRSGCRSSGSCSPATPSASSGTGSPTSSPCAARRSAGRWSTSARWSGSWRWSRRWWCPATTIPSGAGTWCWPACAGSATRCATCTTRWWPA